ncbi:MAG: linear amide C-N hydrolase [Bdellovibrionales bacterium]|nr:linear amide C-N hydrolase [Bdellovibrionales bacterium]
MRVLRMFVAAVSMWAVGLAPSVEACSTLMVPNSNAKLMGKNYVWQLPHGRLFHNRIGMRKKAMLEDDSLEALEWVSKYTSLTFNQFAENFPIGGMNSEGLAVEVLLARADFPATTEKKAVNELQWVQYLLDTSASVEEAMAKAKKVDIVPLSSSAIHYHVCDRTGDCAAVEYIDGELAISHKKEDGVCPLSVTNSRATSTRKPAFLEAEDLSFDSLDARLLPPAEMADHADTHLRGLLNTVGGTKSKSPAEEVADMYAALERMSGQPQWQIVYELQNNRVHFKTQAGGRVHYSVAFSDFDKTYDRECKNAIFFHKSANRWLVLPPSRFDLAGRATKSTHENFFQSRTQSTHNLERADFSLVNSGATLLEQSRSFLRSTGLSTEMLEKLELYQNTHTGCASEENEKAAEEPTVSQLIDDSEIQALFTSYEAGKGDIMLARYEGPAPAPERAALAMNTPRHEPKAKPKPEPTEEPKVVVAPAAPAPTQSYQVGFRYFYSNENGLRVRSVGDRTGYKNAIRFSHSSNNPAALAGLWVRVHSIGEKVSHVSYPNQRGWQPLPYNQSTGAAEASFFLYAYRLDVPNRFQVEVIDAKGHYLFNEEVDAPISYAR